MRADRIPLDDFLVNEYLDCAAGAVLDHRGEVLRYIGAAVFLILPYQVNLEVATPRRVAHESIELFFIGASLRVGAELGKPA